MNKKHRNEDSSPARAFKRLDRFINDEQDEDGELNVDKLTLFLFEHLSSSKFPPFEFLLKFMNSTSSPERSF